MYRADEEACRKKWPYPQARDVLGDYRRADIEVQLASVKAARHQRALISVNANRTNSSFHTLVKFDQIMMVQSYTKSAGQLVPRSLFRLGYAAQSQVVLPPRDLFLENPDVIIDISKPIFTILIHGHNRKDKSRPAFAHVVIPDNTYRMYVDHINLFLRFPEIVAEFAQKIPESNTKAPDMSIRQDKKGRRNQRRNES